MAESQSATFLNDAGQSTSITNSNVFVGQGQTNIASSSGSTEYTPKTEVDNGRTGYSVMFEDIFVYSETPLRKGTRVFKGFQKHANGHRTNVAIKMIAPFDKKNLREVDHLITLTEHPNVVKIIRSKECAGRACPELYIVMELCEEETFKDYCEKTSFDFDQIISYCKQLLNGVKHIHDHNIIHGDLKPENILISYEKTIKVSDFGISKQLENGKSKTCHSGCGTDSYRAPETFQSDDISTSADIHSLGVILFGAFTKGKHPFGKNTYSQVHNMMENKSCDLSGLPDEMSDLKKSEFRKLLGRMLEFDPKKRPTIDQVLDDDFFTSSDVSNVEHAQEKPALDEEDKPVLQKEERPVFDEEEPIPRHEKIWPRVLKKWLIITLLITGVAVAVPKYLWTLSADECKSEVAKPIRNLSEKVIGPPLDDYTFHSSQGWIPSDLLHGYGQGIASVKRSFVDWLGYLTCPTGFQHFVTSFKDGAVITLRNSLPEYIKSWKFDVNNETKSIADLADLDLTPICPQCRHTTDGLISCAESLFEEHRSCAAGLVIWFETERLRYLAVNLGDEKMRLNNKGSDTYLRKGVAVEVSSSKDLVKSAMNKSFFFGTFPLFQIIVECSDPGPLKLEFELPSLETLGSSQYFE